MSEQMRKEFEAWCPDSLQTEPDGSYKQPFTRAYWKAWQAALATQPQAPQGAVTDEKLFAELGKEMYGITTTVHSPEIPFDEQLRCIPSVWQMLVKERDELRLAAKAGPVDAPVAHLRAKTSIYPWGGVEVCLPTDVNAFPVYRRANYPFYEIRPTQVDFDNFSALAFESDCNVNGIFIKAGTAFCFAPKTETSEGDKQ